MTHLTIEQWSDIYDVADQYTLDGKPVSVLAEGSDRDNLKLCICQEGMPCYESFKFSDIKVEHCILVTPIGQLRAWKVTRSLIHF